MERSLLNITMAAFISCFAACSEEEIIATQDGTPKEVTVMAQVPTNPATRSVGVDNVIGDNQLRCILSVVNSANNSELARIEKLVGADDTKISFTFTVGSDVDYNCLFWADYVDNNVSKSGERYADKYYNTTNLQGISVKVDADTPANNAKLFNNAAADAFYGVLPKAYIDDSQTPSITLKRPFAKLNLKPESNDGWANQITTMDIEFNMPGEFNMLTGKAAGSKTPVKATGVSKAENAYFSTFLFIEDPETAKFNDDIKISFVKPGSEPSETVTRTIKGGFNIKPNNEINGEANLSKEQDITVDVTVDGKPEDPNAPKVGDYFYTDGTWSTELNGEKTVAGVIFDLAADDVLENYEGSNLQDKVRGWVVALNDISAKWYDGSSNLTGNNLTNTIEGVAVPTSTGPEQIAKELLGYKNSKAITAVTTDSEKFPANTECSNWSPKIPSNTTSGWYFPSIAQLQRIYQAETTITDKLIAASGKAVNTGVYLSSTLYKTKELSYAPLGINLKEADKAEQANSYGIARTQRANGGYYVRAVLTF